MDDANLIEGTLDGELQISPSQVVSFMKCQMKSYFTHFLRRPFVDAPYFAFGRVLHKAIETFSRMKLSSHTNPPFEELSLLYKDFCAEEPLLQEEPEYGIKCLELLYQHLATKQPKRIEERVSILVEGMLYEGFVDLQLEGPTPTDEAILDFKTVGKSPIFDKVSQQYMADSYDLLQLTGYGLQITKAAYPVKAELLYLVKTQKPKLIPVLKVITPEEMEIHKRTVLKVYKSIKEQLWLPTGRGTRYCSERYCTFFKECHSIA